MKSKITVILLVFAIVLVQAHGNPLVKEDAGSPLNTEDIAATKKKRESPSLGEKETVQPGTSALSNDEGIFESAPAKHEIQKRAFWHSKMRRISGKLKTAQRMLRRATAKWQKTQDTAYRAKIAKDRLQTKVTQLTQKMEALSSGKEGSGGGGGGGGGYNQDGDQSAQYESSEYGGQQANNEY